MRKPISKRKNNTEAVIYLLIFAAVLYFSYHIINGNRGLLTMFQLRQELQKAAEELTFLQAERDNLERKIRYLHPHHLDLDFLDEIARKELGLIKEDEMLIIVDK
jgi:cell division protein FtsB